MLDRQHLQALYESRDKDFGSHIAGAGEDCEVGLGILFWGGRSIYTQQSVETVMDSAKKWLEYHGLSVYLLPHPSLGGGGPLGSLQELLKSLSLSDYLTIFPLVASVYKNLRSRWLRKRNENLTLANLPEVEVSLLVQNSFSQDDFQFYEREQLSELTRISVLLNQYLRARFQNLKFSFQLRVQNYERQTRREISLRPSDLKSRSVKKLSKAIPERLARCKKDRLFFGKAGLLYRELSTLEYMNPGWNHGKTKKRLKF